MKEHPRTERPQREPSFLVGPWRVLPDLHRLSRGETDVPVEPRVMDVLVFLAKNAGRVVMRDELLDAVWGDRVVNEEALTRAIWEIRRALGDDPRKPEYVETIRKGGYRLVAPVRFERDPEPVPDEAPKIVPPGRARLRLAVVAAALAILSLLVLLGAREMHRRPAGPPLLAGAPLASLPGAERDPALSPDGTAVAFAWNGGEGEDIDIYVLQRSAGAPLRLTDEPGTDRFPAWSPDGSEIAFFRAGEEGGIYAVPSMGGAARVLLRAPYWIQGLDWSPDGKRIAFSGRADREHPTQIAVLSLESGEVSSLTRPETRYSCDFWPRFSPDGRRIAFGRSGPVFQQDLYVVPSGGGTEERVTFLEGKIEGLAWIAGGAGLVFGFARASDYGLYEVPLGGAPAPLPLRGRDAIRPSISRDGKLVYEERTVDRDIGRILLGPGEEAVLDEKPLLASTKVDRTARFSPRDGRIAFVSDRTGTPEIWIADGNGGSARRATRMGGAYVLGPHWSPDGRRIAFSVREGDGTAMYWMDAEGASPVRFGGDSPQGIVSGWSLDGGRVYYECWNGDAWEARSRTLDGSEDALVLPYDGRVYRESADGRLIFQRFETGGIWAGRPGGAEEERLVDPDAMAMWSGVAVEEAGAYFAIPMSGGDMVGYLDFKAGKTKRIAKLPWSGVSTLSLSPDGSTLLFDFDRSVESDLVLVEAFR